METRKMSTGTQPVLEDGSETLKASPDWIKTSTDAELGPAETSEENRGLVELKYRSVENVATAKFAKGLGMFSIALGLAEVLAPGQMAGLIGISDKYRPYLPLLGAREIAHGVGIMRSEKPTAAVWTRVGGDAIDLAFLGAAMADTSTNKRRLGAAVAAVAGVTLLDLLCAQKLSKPWTESDGNPLAPTTAGQTSARRSIEA
jgi:hypothetical protein